MADEDGNFDWAEPDEEVRLGNGVVHYRTGRDDAA